MGRHFPDLMTLMLATVIPSHRLNEGCAVTAAGIPAKDRARHGWKLLLQPCMTFPAHS
jgi:hypothetical protein